jgi:hypothetical protein
LSMQQPLNATPNVVRPPSELGRHSDARRVDEPGQGMRPVAIDPQHLADHE